jgi:hypothetical protein
MLVLKVGDLDQVVEEHKCKSHADHLEKYSTRRV